MIKINERALVHIAQSLDNPIDHSGWLFKLSEEKKTFQKRWCVLKENLFFYYEQKNDKEPAGVILLECYRVEIIESVKEHFAFKIDFGTSQYGLHLKSYIFSTETHSDLERWVKALSCASYDYLKMVVSELQHRLDELSMIRIEENVPSKETSSENGGKRVEQGPSTALPTRFNPFDEMREVPNVTFLELHERYGRRIRRCFTNQAPENDPNQ